MLYSYSEILDRLERADDASAPGLLEWMAAHPHPLWLRGLELLADPKRAGAWPADSTARPAAGRVVDAVQAKCPLVAAPAAELSSRLKSESDPSKIVELAAALAAVAGLKVAASLSGLMTHAEARVRVAGVDALGALRDDAVVARLLPALADPDARVAAVAGRVFRSFRAGVREEAVDRALAGTDARAVAGALRALSFAAPEDAVPRLERALLRPAVAERRLAAAGLAAAAVAGSGTAPAQLKARGLLEALGWTALLAPAAWAWADEPELPLAAHGSLSALSAVPPGHGDRAAAAPDALLAGAPADARNLRAAALGLEAGALSPAARAALEGADRAPERAGALLSGTDDGADEPVPDARKVLTLVETGHATPGRIRRWLRARSEPEVTVRLLGLAHELSLPDRAELAALFAANPDLEVRRRALAVLESAEGADADAALAVMVQDRDDGLADRALELLRRRAPEAARQAVAPLLTSGQAKEVRRGLALLEKLNDPGAVGLVLAACSAAPLDEGVQDQLVKLLVAWSRADAIDQLVEMHAAAPKRHWPVFHRLAHGVAKLTDYPAGRVDERLALAASSKNQPARPTSSMMVEPAADAPGPQAPKALVGAVGLVIVALIGITKLVGPGGPATGTPDRPGVDSAPAAVAVVMPKRAPIQAAKSLPVVRSSGSFRDVLADLTKGQKLPSLETIEKEVGAQLAAENVRSKRMIRMLALDRIDEGYHRALDRARALVKAGKPAETLPLLEQALTDQPPDHILARVALLKQLVEAARRARDPKAAAAFQERLRLQRAQLGEILAEAARDAGRPSEEVDAIKLMYTHQERKAQHALKIAELFTVEPVEPQE